MEIEVDEAIECPACGARQIMTIVKSANVARLPKVKGQLLDGTFMRHTCRRCEVVLEIERELLWFDLDKRLMILCFERSEAEHVDACEADAIEVFENAAWKNCPPAVRALAPEISLRVVFGYDQLREKVLCSEHGLNDKMVEFLKLAVMVAHPDWQQGAAFEGLRLLEVQPTALVFQHEVDGPKPLIEVQRTMLEEIVASPQAFIDWAPQVWSGPYVNAKSVVLAGEAFASHAGTH